jgi:hypothetical protein
MPTAILEKFHLISLIVLKTMRLANCVEHKTHLIFFATFVQTFWPDEC